jgi:transcriptional regulator with XRE-family HTH domain
LHDNEDRIVLKEQNRASAGSKAAKTAPLGKVSRSGKQRLTNGKKTPPSFYDMGRQIRDLRKAKSLSLVDLSRLTGKSIGHLSQIERNKSEPSLRVLQEISNALGVQIGYFFQETEPVPPNEQGLIVRKSRRKRLNYGNGLIDYLLSPNLSGQLELLLCEFDPGYSSGGSIFHKGEEAGLIVSGALDLWIGDKHFHLGEGDSFTFESSTPHRFENNGKSKTVVVWAITPPTY